MRFIFALGLAGPEDSTVPNESHAIAGMFAAIFEYELGDVGFARSPRSSAINSVVLFLCGARERQIETEIAREFERDSAVFGCMRGGEKAAVLAILHVFTVGFEHARVRTGLRENLSQHR